MEKIPFLLRYTHIFFGACEREMIHRIEDPTHDLTTPDGTLVSLVPLSETEWSGVVHILQISPFFVGFSLPKEKLFFNGKSALAQLGIDILGKNFSLHQQEAAAEVEVSIKAHGAIAKEFLRYLTPGTYIGKIFARDERRLVRNPDYITRMFGRSDRMGNPLLSLGALHGSDSLLLDVVDGRTVAYLSLLKGKVIYDASIFGLLPTIAKALRKKLPVRELLLLHQVWLDHYARNVSSDEILLVKTPPLHIHTVFASVVQDLLTPGYTHTSASILQPDTMASGDIYEFFGDSKREITDIPLEFYTLEPYRENIFFSDRDQLQSCLENTESIIQAFATAPSPKEAKTAVFIVKGQQFKNLTPQDWTSTDPVANELPGVHHTIRQAMLIERFITQQPSYPFLKAMEDGRITSQGVLFTRYLPSPLMKRMLLSEEVSRYLKGIYFQIPSRSHGDFFSTEDRGLLTDIHKYGIPVYWVDEQTSSVLQYVQKPKNESGMFVPPHLIDKYLQSTVFGVYGSNLVVGPFETELRKLLAGLLEMRNVVSHPLLSRDTPLALVTGGGPGAMELANKVAKEMGILSCANIADFRLTDSSTVNEQKQNPYVEAKMTYRLKELVDRQAAFNLDFPIFVTGGIGTDFEYCLEEVRRKVGCVTATPVLLFGETSYWREKITSRYQQNMHSGTITGSEWISNCFFCIQTAEQGLAIYKNYFENNLPIGKEGPTYPLGFVTDPLKTV